MPRAALYIVLGLALAGSGGCSLILDFSNKAIPVDAAPLDADPACAFDEPNNAATSAASVTTADTGPAAICPGVGSTDDFDFYRFEVPANTSSVILQLAYQPRTNGDLALAIDDSTGAQLAMESDSSTTKTIVCPALDGSCGTLVAGTYLFEVSPLVPGNANDYSFSLTIQ
jgi:hypothetical protein